MSDIGKMRTNSNSSAHKAAKQGAGFARIVEFTKVASSINKKPQSLRAIALKKYQEQRDRFPKAR